MSRALTSLGLNRERYSVEVEPAPKSRFDCSGAYTLWAARADAHEWPDQASIHKEIDR